jgi:dimethylaniline monooxygenase (N-oxide forming)
VQGKNPKELQCDHKILEQSPTIRGDFLEKVRTKTIHVQRAGIDRFTETGLLLDNGVSLENVDVVICCTGYNFTALPYLPKDAIASREEPAPHIDLYKLLVSPWYENLYVLGHVELVGPFVPAGEAQARAASAMISGRIARPSHEAMMRDIRAFRAWQSKNFVHSERHILSAFCLAYVDSLLDPLGARPTAGKLLGQMFTGNPLRAIRVFKAVYFGVPSSAQWRLLGYGKKEELARATVLRIAGGKAELSADEKRLLGM